MKPFLCACLILPAATSMLAAKPPPARNAPAAVQPVPAVPAGSFLAWLLEQNGGPAAVTVSFREVIQSSTGRSVTPFDKTNSVDAAVAEKIGAVMDNLLPRLNRPDGETRAASSTLSASTSVIDQVQKALREDAALHDLLPQVLDAPGLGDAAPSYPVASLEDKATHRIYYLGITFVPAEGDSGSLPVLAIDPGALAKRLPKDGACLLLVFEHNNKSGKDLAFLNWRLVDLQDAKVRVRVEFSGVAGETLPPAATITDGRKGRD